MDKIHFQTLQSFPVGVGITDSEGKFIYVNPAFEQMFLYESGELLGQPGYVLNAPSDEDPAILTEKINQSMQSKGYWEGEVHCKKKDGTLFWTQAKLSTFEHPTLGPLWLGIQEDSTEKKSMELQLLQSQKMEALGEMAGGIAHEFNNMLATILGNVELVLMDEQKSSLIKNQLMDVMEAAERAAELVSQILFFSRKGTSEKQRISPVKVVSKTCKLVLATRPRKNLAVDLADDCGEINANSTQLHQICLNLINNAVQALPPSGGEVRVIARKINRSDLPTGIELDSFLRTEEVFHLSIRDSGRGIPQENLESIFEPFFTTKEAGEGTGLGLSIVSSLVKRQEGAIKVHSVLGEGTTFDLYFPGFDESQPSVEHKSQRPCTAGDASVLIVEDQPNLAQIYSGFLSEVGYRTTVCHSGREALEAYLSDPVSFDLLFTDLELPEMNGRELVAKIRATGSDIPIMLATGFFTPEVYDTLSKLGVDQFFVKPVPLNELRRVIEQVLSKTIA